MAKASAQSPNIYLVGFMGTGKSTVGRMLAKRLGLSFVDSDQCIEQEQGRSIKAIFAEDGEACFRQLERHFVQEGHCATGMVVACGGGLVAQPGMMAQLKRRGVVASLFARPETILERTSRNTARPLLNVPDPKAHILRLLKQREPFYLKAGACFLTDRRPVTDLVDQLASYYFRAARDFRKQAPEAAGKLDQ
jgi:shikimate kinase